MDHSQVQCWHLGVVTLTVSHFYHLATCIGLCELEILLKTTPSFLIYKVKMDLWY